MPHVILAQCHPLHWTHAEHAGHWLSSPSRIHRSRLQAVHVVRCWHRYKESLLQHLTVSRAKLCMLTFQVPQSTVVDDNPLTDPTLHGCDAICIHQVSNLSLRRLCV
jgi:hypothetical protein